MSLEFYMDGEMVSGNKAKEIFKEYSAKHILAGYVSDEDCEWAWRNKSRSEDARETINNVTESQLEVVCN